MGSGKSVLIYIFGTHLSRAEGVTPIELLTGRDASMKKYFRQKIGHKTRPELHERAFADCVTSVDVKLLGGRGDVYDVEGRLAAPIIRGDVTSDELERWAKAACAGEEMSAAHQLIGLVHAQRLRQMTFYRPYMSKKSIPECYEQKSFCKYFQSVMKLRRNPHTPKFFLADIYSGVDTARFGSSVPPCGTELSLRFHNGIELIGEVVVTGLDSLVSASEQASRTVPTGQQSSKVRKPDFQVSVSEPRATSGSPKGIRKATLAFPDDSAKLDRHLRAVLVAADSAEHWHGNGIYVPQLLFGCDVPEGHRLNHYRDSLTENDKQVFLGELVRGLSGSQQAFAQDCPAPTNGLAIARGLSGDEKSITIMAMLQSLTKTGKKVLVCAPSNDSVTSLFKAFHAHSDADYMKGTYCVWTEDYVKTGYQREEVFVPPPHDHEDSLRPRKKTGHQIQKASDESKADRYVDDTECKPTNADESLQGNVETGNFEHTRLMSQCWIEQGTRMAGAKFTDKFGFDYRRAELALALENKGPEYGSSEIAKRYVQRLRTFDSMDETDKAEFYLFENELNEYYLSKHATIVFSSCSMAVHETLEAFYEPDIIIIDEAGAVTDMEMAIPLTTFDKSVKGVVLVGDIAQRHPKLPSRASNSAAKCVQTTIFERYVNRSRSALRSDMKPHVHTFDA